MEDICFNNKCYLSSADFLDYFKSINDPDSISLQPDEDVLHSNERYVQGELDVMFSELNAPFVVNDIIKAGKQLKNGKSAGPDYLKMHFLNMVFNQMYLPEQFVHCLKSYLIAVISHRVGQMVILLFLYIGREM